MLRAGTGRGRFTRAAMSAAAPTPPPIACVFPFDADEATVQSFGFTARVPLSNGDQTFTYTVQSALAGSQTHAAVPGVLGQLDASTGIVTFEMPFTDPVFSGGTTAQLVLQTYNFYTAGFAIAMIIRRIYRANGTRGLLIQLGGATVYSVNDVAVGYIGVEMNATAGTVTIKADNVPLVLSANTYTPQAFTPVYIATESAGVSGTFAGQIASSTFRSNAADYQGTYTAGALDVCGNPI